MTAPLRRGSRAVAVLAAAGDDAFLRCLESVLAHTPQDVPVLVPSAMAKLPVVGDVAAAGRVRPVEEVTDAAADADLAVLDGTALIGDGWLEGLAAALAAGDGTFATASAVTLGDGPAGLHRRRGEHPADRTPDEVIRDVRSHAARAHPRLPAPQPGCMLIARPALDACRPLDDGFAARCSAHGLVHVVADDVLAYPVAERGAPPEPLGGLAPDAVSRAIVTTARGVEGLSVTIDARILTGVITGTQVQALELIAGLHRTGAARLRAVVPHDLGPHARAALEGMDGIELLSADELPDHLRRSVVVHRPYQVSSAEDLLLLRRLGHRLVITHQDLIGYDVAAYHADPATWQAYRRLTREALAAADMVVTVSEHVASELRTECLVDADRVRAIPHGTDHRLHGLDAEPARPEALDALGGRPFLLCLGTDLRHKHRHFAIALLRALRELHGWDGALVLAGPQVPFGSSQPEEAAERLAHPELEDTILSLASVDEARKRWLYREAAAVVYPTLREGFGLVPAEAAAAGTPCLFARQAALAELYPPELARLVPWDPAASADAAVTVLRDDDERRRLVDGLRRRASELRWDRSAAELLDAYEAAVRAEPRQAAVLAWAAMEADAARRRAEEALARRPEVDPLGLLLVGPDGLLPDDARRTLAGLARRAPTRRLLLATLHAMRRAVLGDEA